jgi:hypothetical protein
MMTGTGTPYFSSRLGFIHGVKQKLKGRITSLVMKMSLIVGRARCSHNIVPVLVPQRQKVVVPAILVLVSQHC